MGKKETKEKKPIQFRKIYELLTKYNQVIVVSLSNVGSKQVQEIRRTLVRRNAILVIGKNTLFKKALTTRILDLEEDHPYYNDLKQYGEKGLAQLDCLKNTVAGKVGFIFTNETVFDLKPFIESNRKDCAAKVGGVAPCDVIIPPGPTNMDPSQISFFHALMIPTKIEKGQIQITKDFVVIKKGQKVGASQAILLQKLSKKPFNYGMEVVACYDNGSMLNKAQVQMNLNDIATVFANNVKNIAAISLEQGWINEVSAPHIVHNNFKKLAAIGFGSGFLFSQLQGSSQPAQQAQQEQPKQQQQAKAPEPVPAEEPEEDLDMGGMFD